MDVLRSYLEQALTKIYKEAVVQIQAKLDEQIAESERVLQRLLQFEASGDSSSMVSLQDVQALCQTIQDIPLV